MTTVLLDDSNLSAIGNALRAKTGSTDLYKPREMAAAIDAIEGPNLDCTGMHIPEEAVTITGDCTYKFAYSGWNWFLDELEDKITTSDITATDYMFDSNKNLESIPFDLNFKTSSTYHRCNNIFKECNKLKEIGAINNLKPGIGGMDKFFYFCTNLRYLPQFNNLDMSYFYSNSYSLANMFYYCCSLRSVSEEFMKKLYSPKQTSYYSSFFYGLFQNCYVLDEVRGIVPQTGNMTSNAFNGAFYNCYRLKEIIFATQEDGTPYSVNWKSQTINLKYMGYCQNADSYITTVYNSGITADKKVTDDATYQALKNDPDWWTSLQAYSRYNHDSAVNTINTLPDTSAYGTNTIQFIGALGSATDGGAINTLTEEEIAVATAKGWTVTLA